MFLEKFSFHFSTSFKGFLKSSYLTARGCKCPALGACTEIHFVAVVFWPEACKLCYCPSLVLAKGKVAKILNKPFPFCCWRVTQNIL